MACGSMVQMKALPGWKSSLWCFPAVDCYSAFSVFTLMATECQIPLPLSWREITADRGVILSLIKPTLPAGSRCCYYYLSPDSVCCWGREVKRAESEQFILLRLTDWGILLSLDTPVHIIDGSKSLSTRFMLETKGADDISGFLLSLKIPF